MSEKMSDFSDIINVNTVYNKPVYKSTYNL